MREILFRGKCIGIGEWVYGTPIYDGNIVYILSGVVEANEEYICIEDWRPVIPETVGQYTGLLDKNGVKIWEGDVVHNRSILPQWDKYLIDETQAVVLIRNGMTRAEGWHANGYIGEEINQVHYGCLLLSPEIFEVIGIIHENPELVEVKK